MTLVIAHKSDNLIFMKELSATEVSRNFSEILDLVEAGEEIVITRGKKEIAKIVPVIDELERNRLAILNHYETKDYFPDDPVWDEMLKLRDSFNEDFETASDWTKSK